MTRPECTGSSNGSEYCETTRIALPQVSDAFLGNAGKIKNVFITFREVLVLLVLHADRSGMRVLQRRHGNGRSGKSSKNGYCDEAKI